MNYGPNFFKSLNHSYFKKRIILEPPREPIHSSTFICRFRTFLPLSERNTVSVVSLLVCYPSLHRRENQTSNTPKQTNDSFAIPCYNNRGKASCHFCFLYPFDQLWTTSVSSLINTDGLQAIYCRFKTDLLSRSYKKKNL